MQATPIAKELVLVGGGHSHVIVLRMLGMKPIPGLQITLISPETRTPYSGILPGVVAGHYTSDDIHIDLVPLCRFAGARFIRGQVKGIDAGNQTVNLMADRPDIRYDVLSIDIGITPSLAVPGAEDRVIPVKPINSFLDHWQQFLRRLGSGAIKRVGFVGGGAGGVELALAVQHYVNTNQADVTDELEWWLYTDREEVLSEHPAAVRNTFSRILSEQGFTVESFFRVSGVDETGLHAMDGRYSEVDEIFWVTSAASQQWLAETGLSLDEDGFVLTRDTLQTLSHDNVFAAGDIAHVQPHPRPKAGVYAVRQGPPLAANIRRRLLEKPTKPFIPQTDFLSLISAGGRYAVASRNRRKLEGSWVWLWKNWIDQRFMRRFSDLPDMKGESRRGLLKEFDGQMQCGGCGSKVSAELLNGVLDGLGDIVRDDASVYEVPAGKTMLHTVDHFKSFVDDPFLFARIAVTHALSDIYAMGGEPVTALAMVTVPYGKPPVVRAVLEQLLTGAKQQLDLDGVSLTGGHTTEGAELAIGFAVNGVVTAEEILPKDGLRPDQVLILTKPVGTGTLFAADMQHRARGEWISAACESMVMSNREALRVLRKHDVSACTDVTGFGVAGHLLEMTNASGCGAVLDLDALPVLEGALTTLGELRITSTLHDGNRQSATEVSVSTHRNSELLFDPQTSGGLLAAVPADRAEQCIDALHKAGYIQAAIIGRTVEGSGLDY